MGPAVPGAWSGGGRRFLLGLVLGFGGPAAVWATSLIPVSLGGPQVLTIVTLLPLIVLLAPVGLFALIGFTLRGWGLLGAMIGCVLAVPVVFALAPVIDPHMGEALADSIGFGMPFEIVALMLPAGMIGWLLRAASSWGSARASQRRLNG